MVAKPGDQREFRSRRETNSNYRSVYSHIKKKKTPRKEFPTDTSDRVSRALTSTFPSRGNGIAKDTTTELTLSGRCAGHCSCHWTSQPSSAFRLPNSVRRRRFARHCGYHPPAFPIGSRRGTPLSVAAVNYLHASFASCRYSKSERCRDSQAFRVANRNRDFRRDGGRNVVFFFFFFFERKIN